MHTPNGGMLTPQTEETPGARNAAEKPARGACPLAGAIPLIIARDACIHADRAGKYTTNSTR